MQGISSANLSGSFELRRNVPASAGASVVSSTATDPRLSSQISSEVSKTGATSTVELDRTQKSDPEQLNNMLEKVNRQMEVNSSNLRFKVDENSGKMVVAIYDATTDELIRQIPNEQVLSTAQKLNEFLQRSKSDPLDALASAGMLLNSQA